MTKEFKIYTKTGDDGTTGLVGGSRVKKFDVRLEAYGTVDELNAAIGLLRGYSTNEEIETLLIHIQNKLFNIGARLATDTKGADLTANLAITESHTKVLEDAIDKYQAELPKLNHFILPGGEPAVAQCHVARTVCRRAERRILEFAEQSPVQSETIKYINRLSDLLFVLSRKMAYEFNLQETAWSKD